MVVERIQRVNVYVAAQQGAVFVVGIYEEDSANAAVH
jgi:hypothetical protein